MPIYGNKYMQLFDVYTRYNDSVRPGWFREGDVETLYGGGGSGGGSGGGG